ncbi:MAG: universal stress protein [Hyphomicrobiaceae bacterium]
MLACVDPRSSSIDEGCFDRIILELANSLADANGAELHIVHAWNVEGPDLDRIRAEITDAARSGILTKHEALHRNRVEAILGNVANLRPDHKLHLPRSAAHEAITGLVADLSVDLIVMGSVNKTGISGFFIGSAAEAVLSTARCSLFTVKPKNFRSPVVLECTPARAAG